MSKKKTKRANYSRRAKTQQKSPIAWLVGGILIGLVIPSLWLLQSHTKSQTQLNKPNLKITQEEILAPAPDKIKSKHTKHLHANRDHSSKANYEFYNLLSSQEENGSHGSTNETTTTSDTFIVEIAKYKTYLEADQLKAKLLLTGIDDISIIKISKGKHTLYRVLAGPFGSRFAATKAQRQLKQNSIDSVLIIE